MPNGIWALALGAAMQVGQPGPSETPNYPPLQNAYNQYGFEGQYEQRFPFDTQQNWVHGYYQEIPAYGGHAFFRPYNYKDILSQSQVSAGWGQSPVLPYSQQFWHKYHDQATMLKLSRNEGLMPLAPPAYTNENDYVLPAANTYTAQQATGRPVYYYVPQPLPAPVGPYPVQSIPVGSEAPAANGPVLQPASGQQFVNPAYAPR